MLPVWPANLRRHKKRRKNFKSSSCFSGISHNLPAKNVTKIFMLLLLGLQLNCLYSPFVFGSFYMIWFFFFFLLLKQTDNFLFSCISCSQKNSPLKNNWNLILSLAIQITKNTMILMSHLVGIFFHTFPSFFPPPHPPSVESPNHPSQQLKHITKILFYF